ncbi:protein of unknown function [Pseudomonas sp. JV551A1]|uniref:Uncharacterized protein n=1 Tax=Pseudomonas inefficax TaxID=2078786 RepID=A0AAQ1PBE7_9PSED|nr:protein of unknown function [Pseudomonas sp. JV551A1]SPO61129.1 protein of unknown function [Pseudomonas inefficax]
MPAMWPASAGARSARMHRRRRLPNACNCWPCLWQGGEHHAIPAEAAIVGIPFVGAALRRERSAQRSPFSGMVQLLLGLLRSPFATQGRSHKGRIHKRGAHRAFGLVGVRGQHGTLFFCLCPGPDRT